MMFCEKRMYAYWQKNYLCLSGNVQQGKMQELNNYFAGRFIKIAQVLLLDAGLSQQFITADNVLFQLKLHEHILSSAS